MIAMAHFGIAGPLEASEEGCSSPAAFVEREEEEEEVPVPDEEEGLREFDRTEESEDADAAEREEIEETDDSDDAVRRANVEDNEVGAAVSEKLLGRREN